MKKSTFLAFILFTIMINVIGQNNYQNEWNEVESLVRKGLPQSALKIAEQIYADARTANNAPQFLKASIYLVKLQSDYQEDFLEKNIERLNKELAESKSPVKQIHHSILAELYWRYYQANRYLFMDRSALAKPDRSDIRTWDVRTLIDEVSGHYRASLEDKDILQGTALGMYDPIIEQKEGSRKYRPTLYDFLAHRALDFFMNEEAGLTRPAISFSIDKPEYFLPASEFVSLALERTGNNEFRLESLQILRELLRFHLDDDDPAALIDADLKRIRFVEENAVMPERFELYLKALENIRNVFSQHPNSTDASYEIALEYLRRGAQYNPFISEDYRWDIKKAKETCEHAVNSFPGSDGAKNCSILLEEMIRPALSFDIKYANLPENPFLASLEFKNLKKVYFRIISMDPGEDRQLKQKQRNEGLVDKYRSVTPLKSWSIDLPDPGDFQGHTTQIRIASLSKGYYVLLASEDPEFSTNNKIVAHASFWITGISYITENKQDDGQIEIFVLDRQKGIAMKGVKAQAYVRDYDYSTRSYQNRPMDSYLTDNDGRISISSQNVSKTFYLEFTSGDDRFYTENYFYIYPPRQEEKSHDITYFFTDRSIYRPGQTIYFKGIVLKRTGGNSVVQPGFSSLVALYDANGQKVSELLLTTNDFGSFNGVFTAPAGGLTGEMSIRNESGSATFSVEEYKRPKFRVEIDSLEGHYRLNEPVTVTGKALAYAGNAVDQADVTYRVVRTARFPVWRDWWYWFPNVPETEILHGQTKTSADGSFSLTFTAYPDLQVDPKFQPVFNYRILVDVTDMTGEMRSADEMVSVGYQAMLLDINIPDKVNSKGGETFEISSKNLNGKPVQAAGKMIVYPLEAPARLLRDRSWDRPDVFVIPEPEFRKDFPNEIYSNEMDPETWNKGKAIIDRSFNTNNRGEASLGNLSGWKAGNYLLVLESTDAFGQKVEAKKFFAVYHPDDEVLPVNKPFWHAVLNNQGEPGDTAVFIVGSGEKNVKLLYEIENDGKLVKREWIALSQSKKKVIIPIKEEFRGNFFVKFLFVKENRSYQCTEKVIVPYTDRELKITTETFRSKLIPGQEEEWRIRITGMKGEKVTSELLTSMYDASLDAFREHGWYFDLYPTRHASLSWDTRSAFNNSPAQMVRKVPASENSPVTREYDQLNWFGFNYYRGGMPRWVGGNRMMMKNFDAMAAPGMAESEAPADEVTSLEGGQQIPPVEEGGVIKPQEVPVRRNFAETAFFFPSLTTDDQGDAILKFTVPESLTAWNFMMLAYTRDLKTGQLEKEVVTRKDLMVMPNPPRFFREGDRISFSAKVVSLAEERLQGEVTAEFFDALTMKPIDGLVGNQLPGQSFDIAMGNSQVFGWQITVPETMEAIVCRVKAVSGSMADGEEIVIPVLPNRMLVTETLPMPVNGNSTRNFTFEKLVNSGKLATLKSYRLTLEFTSNPAWYAVQALPYLTGNPTESADNLFTRFYANSLAGYIANSSPKIRQVFDNWKTLSPDAFLSNLEKNQELKAVLLNETPWVMEARDETERKKRIAVLFDLNRMADEKQSDLGKLRQMQSPNGGWPWFEGMPDNRYITQAIITGIGKLQHLGVIDLEKEPDLAGMVNRAMFYMDARIGEDYENLKRMDKIDLDDNHISSVQVQYLYSRSLLVDLAEINPSGKEAFEYYKGQARKYWLEQDKYLQGMIALALFRLGEEEVPGDILRSLHENALWDEEMGLYWRDEGGYYWHQAPIERQALMIEAFSEVAKDQGAVEQLKIWLLKQKQTQDWKTPRATADAIYALILKGTDLLASDELVDVKVGGQLIEPLKLDGVQVESGIGYFQTSWLKKEITPQLGNITVTKKDEGIAWGAMYWQYYEQLDKITPAKSPLSIEKELYLEKNTAAGPVLELVNDATALKTGDKVTVRVVIRTDRDLEFVHMKDMRAAAFEPVEVLSGYRYQGGLGYYESIRDASVNFFFDYLRKGTYVFEYTVNVTQKGYFSNGITSIQCLYAPEFSAHSHGEMVKVE